MSGLTYQLIEVHCDPDIYRFDATHLFLNFILFYLMNMKFLKLITVLFIHLFFFVDPAAGLQTDPFQFCTQTAGEQSPTQAEVVSS